MWWSIALQRYTASDERTSYSPSNLPTWLRGIMGLCLTGVRRSAAVPYRTAVIIPVYLHRPRIEAACRLRKRYAPRRFLRFTLQLLHFSRCCCSPLFTLLHLPRLLLGHDCSSFFATSTRSRVFVLPGMESYTVIAAVIACFVGSVLGAVDANNGWAFPGREGPSSDTPWQVGSFQPLEWYTTLSDYNITLWQMDPPSKVGVVWGKIGERSPRALQGYI